MKVLTEYLFHMAIFAVGSTSFVFAAHVLCRWLRRKGYGRVLDGLLGWHDLVSHSGAIHSLSLVRAFQRLPPYGSAQHRQGIDMLISRMQHDRAARKSE